MSFARMKEWRCDKTIFYVRTFPRIWTMAAFPRNILMLFHFPLLSIIHICHLKICKSHKNMSTLSVWVLSISKMSLILSHINTRFLTEHSLCLRWFFSLIFVTCNCTVCDSGCYQGAPICLWPGTSHYWESISALWEPLRDMQTFTLGAKISNFVENLGFFCPG